MANKTTKPTNTGEHYKMPHETLWGKIVLWLILIGMVGGILVSFIVALIGGQA